MSSLPIFDYGAPASDGEADGDDDDAARDPRSRSGAGGVDPSVAPASASERIAPPEGADELVSNAQWQWAISASDAASPDAARSTPRVAAADAPPRRPALRARSSTSPTTGPRTTRAATLPPVAEHPTSSPGPSPAAAEVVAAARQRQAADREKLLVVERLVERECESTSELRTLVARMTSEEFIAACQERCLAGRCGWPLCSSAPRGAERDSERPRGKYRVALAERKVYLRGDLDMFCGDAHRKEAETLGCSLALNLEEGTSNTGASSEGAKKDARSREKADATRSGLEGFGGVGASEKKKTGTGKKGAPASAPDANDAASITKSLVVERFAPRRPTDPAPTAPGSVDGRRVADAVEGFRPKELLPVGKKAISSKEKPSRNPPEGEKQKKRSVTFEVPPEPRADAGIPAVRPEAESGGAFARASAASARELDEALDREVRRDADNASLDVSGSKATFYFDVFQEGPEKANKAGANVMGTFSEGQLKRVDAEEETDPSALENDPKDDEALSDENDEGVPKGEGSAEEAEKEEASKAAAREREALRAAFAGRPSDAAASEGTETDAETDAETEASDDDAAGPGPGAAPPVSEFGATWMMLDGWVTRATFHHLAGEGAGASSSRDGALPPGDGSPPELPPRGGFAGRMSDAAAIELSRAIPAAREALGLRASIAALELQLGKLLRTFFFRSAVPALRPERWALVAAIMLEAEAVRMAREARRAGAEGGANDETPARTPTLPSLAEDAEGEAFGAGMKALTRRARATDEEKAAYLDLLLGKCAEGW